MQYRQLTSPITFSITQNIVGVDDGTITPPPPPALPLDTVLGTYAAFSASRRLRTAYTGPLLRLRRDSDNAEQDIGYTAGNVLDAAAAATFLGVANGFVVRFYDQSGNSRNFENTTAGTTQPLYVASSGLNSKPALSFDGTTQFMDDQGWLASAASDWIALHAIKPSVTTGGVDCLFGSRNFTAADWQTVSLTNINRLGYVFGSPIVYYGTNAGTTDSQVFTCALISTNQGSIRRNAAVLDSGLTYTQLAVHTSTRLGRNPGASNYYTGILSEFVLLQNRALDSDILALELGTISHFVGP